MSRVANRWYTPSLVSRGGELPHESHLSSTSWYASCPGGFGTRSSSSQLVPVHPGSHTHAPEVQTPESSQSSSVKQEHASRAVRRIDSLKKFSIFIFLFHGFNTKNRGEVINTFPTTCGPRTVYCVPIMIIRASFLLLSFLSVVTAQTYSLTKLPCQNAGDPGVHADLCGGHGVCR